MARAEARLPGNAPGDLFVDDACIGCDTCRRIAPETFGGGTWDQAFVERQPEGEARWRRALMALVACPVAAIGAPGRSAAGAARAFPDPVPGAGDVLDCGYASDRSFGAASWLVLRRGGNVLVDSPRFARPLLERIRALGGVRLMVLTHRDDVADHRRWAEALGCERLLHARDVGPSTADVERKVEGDAPAPLGEGLLLVPVPGHTAGSVALLHRERWLFSGDHLWAGEDGRLEAGRDVCWHSWAQQTRSMERLLDFQFQGVFPGHGRPWRAASAEEARREVARVAEAMRAP